MDPTLNSLEELAKVALREEEQVPRSLTPTPNTADVESESTSTVELIRNLTQQFTRTLEQLTQQRCVRTPEPRQMAHPRMTYTGQAQEDPIWFLQSMEQFMNTNGIQDDEERISVVDGQLRGEAKRWQEPYRNLRETYGSFRQRFEDYFNSTKRIAAATTILYGEEQKQEESVASFMTRKRMLMQRLMPVAAEELQAEILINQIDPEIRAYLRGFKFVDLGELTRVATQIEQDIKVKKPERPRRVNEDVGNRRNVGNEPNNATRNVNVGEVHAPPRKPPTPCRFCGEWHYQSTCSRNPFLANRAPALTTPQTHAQGPSGHYERPPPQTQEDHAEIAGPSRLN